MNFKQKYLFSIIVFPEDHRSVVRLGGTCKHLFTLTKDDAIWRPLVKQTFGGATLQLQKRVEEKIKEGPETGEEEETGGASGGEAFEVSGGNTIREAESWREVFPTEAFWEGEDSEEASQYVMGVFIRDAVYEIKTWEEVYKLEKDYRQRCMNEFDIRSLPMGAGITWQWCYWSCDQGIEKLLLVPFFSDPELYSDP